jgi:FAD:protein FMN transferase
MKSRCVELRRARPLLGTVVDLQARGPNDFTVGRGIEDAFEAIARVHRLMSFHHPNSDLSRLNRTAHRQSVTVDPWTAHVLRAAQKFSDESDGAFDVTVGRLLMRWDFLPRLHNGHPERERRTSRTTKRAVVRQVPRFARNDKPCWRDVILEENHAVRFRRPVTIDLGGIAKGFAVDCAIAALKNADVQSGLVNAGGDLRVFGLEEGSVRIRHPLDPGRAAGIVTLQNRAVATSATYFSRKKFAGGMRSALIDAQRQRAFVEDVSVSVSAETCMTADALTKIVIALGDLARPILTRHHADAVILERDLPPCWFTS